MRTVSRSRPIFWRTLTATPWPSLMRPRSKCSVPTKLWLKRSASLRASASTCCARGVKLFMASSLITLLAQHALNGAICPAFSGLAEVQCAFSVRECLGSRRLVGLGSFRPRRRYRTTDVAQTLAQHVRAEQVPLLSGKLFRELLLQMRRLSQDEQFVHQRPLNAGQHSQIDPQAHQRE